MKCLLISILFSLWAISGIWAQSATVDLSGTWKFQTDPEDTGVKDQWYEQDLNDCINLPGSMPEKLKGDEVSVRTRWTGSLYDSSYYFNPYMEKYRVEGQVKPLLRVLKG